MKPLPDWLPSMVSVTPWTSKTFEMLYEIFKRDFKISQPLFEGVPVWTFPENDSGKEVIFWPLPTRQDISYPVDEAMIVEFYSK